MLQNTETRKSKHENRQLHIGFRVSNFPFPISIFEFPFLLLTSDF